MNAVPSENQVRTFRIYERPGHTPELQYGYWRASKSGMQPRFVVYRRWAAKDKRQALEMQKLYEVDIHIRPQLYVGADAEPLPDRMSVARSLRLAPKDVQEVLGRAVKGLTDPLPDIWESHRILDIDVPQRRAGGRQVSVFLAEVAYARLVAMAAAANTTRNRILEALLFAVEDLVPVGEAATKE